MKDVQNTLDEMIRAIAPGRKAPTDILTTRRLYHLRRRLADFAFRSRYEISVNLGAISGSNRGLFWLLYPFLRDVDRHFPAMPE